MSLTVVLVVFHPNIVTETDHYLPIHREAPAFVEQATEQQILVTGIKVSYQFICFLLGLLAVHLFLCFSEKLRDRILFCLYMSFWTPNLEPRLI